MHNEQVGTLGEHLIHRRRRKPAAAVSWKTPRIAFDSGLFSVRATALTPARVHAAQHAGVRANSGEGPVRRRGRARKRFATSFAPCATLYRAPTPGLRPRRRGLGIMVAGGSGLQSDCVLARPVCRLASSRAARAFMLGGETRAHERLALHPAASAPGRWSEKIEREVMTCLFFIHVS